MAKFKDYFNSTTLRGRANVAKATYASFAALYLYKRFTRNKKKDIKADEQEKVLVQVEEPPQPEHFKSPSSGTKDKQNNFLDDETYDKGHKLHEALPPVESESSPCRPDNSQADSTSVAESTVVPSNTICQSGTNKSTTITNEQKSDDDQKYIVFINYN